MRLPARDRGERDSVSEARVEKVGRGRIAQYTGAALDANAICTEDRALQFFTPSPSRKALRHGAVQRNFLT
jgi:hypothetical protein